jgi:hypothetical protein
MMLFKLLKLLGIDVHARMVEIQARFDQRVEAAKDQVKQAAQAAAVVAVLSVLAGLAALSAAAVGLFALYRWISLNYGQFYGLAAVGSALILFAIILTAAAILETKSWSAQGAERADNGQSERLKHAAQAEPQASAPIAAAALEGPQPTHPPTSAADLVAPLSLILSRVLKFPTTGNPALDELLFELRGAAKGAADEAVDGVVRAVRYGDRAKLASVLGTAAVVGWLLARNRAD